jgi:hypothetical protein
MYRTKGAASNPSEGILSRAHSIHTLLFLFHPRELPSKPQVVLVIVISFKYYIIPTLACRACIEIAVAMDHVEKSSIVRCLLRLSEDTAGHVALAEVVLNSALLSGSALGEGCGATERTSEGRVLHADDADVAGTTGGTLAGHTSGHLDLDGEVHDGSGRETSNTDTGDVLGDSGVLEGGRVSSTGGSVDLSGQGTGTVLVDLVEGHGDGAVIGSGGKTRGRSSACGSGNTLLSSSLGSLGACSSSTASGTSSASSATGKSVEKTTLVVGSRTSTSSSATGTSSHEHGDSSTSVNSTATLSASKSRSLATHLAGTDDGSISLRAAEGRGAVTGSTILDGKTRHVYTVGTLDLRDDTVGLDGGGNSSNDGERVTHLDGYGVGL